MGWTSDLVARLEAASDSGITLSPAEVRGLVRYIGIFETSPGLFSAGTARATVDTRLASEETKEARLRPDPPGSFGTLEVEECEGDDVDFEALAELLADAGYKLSSWAPGWHLLARSSLIRARADALTIFAIALGGRSSDEEE